MHSSGEELYRIPYNRNQESCSRDKEDKPHTEIQSDQLTEKE